MHSYRHGFHAGNYADVLKHTVLIQILSLLKEKAKPFLYIDTHSGAGRYALDSVFAVKNSEHQLGVAQFWASERKLPQALADYMDCIQTFNNETLQHYPGSPLIAKHLLRDVDRMLLCETHTTEIQALKATMLNTSSCAIVQEDGYRAALASLPPRERRGLIFLDPSFEVKQEYFHLTEQLKKMVKRFATGIYVIWYPVVKPYLCKAIVSGLLDVGIKRVHQFEVGLTRDRHRKGMIGTGMIVINPPWKLAPVIEQCLPLMAQTFSATGYWHSIQLSGE